MIRELVDDDRPIWDAYVREAPDGLPQHLSGWRDVLRKTYGYETRYLMALEGGQAVGVLPLFLVRSPFLGSTAMTMPGGLCAANPEIAGALIERGREIAGRAGAKQVILRDTRLAWPGDLQTTSNHVHWVVDVRAGAASLWKQLDGNIRRQVRIARRNELRVEIDRTGARIADFHDVLSHFTHRAGTPVFGRSFLEHIVATFAGEFNIVVVYRERQPIAAYFQLEMGRTMYGVWGAARREFLDLRPVYLAYWEILADAAARGFHFLDMGRSPRDTNTSKFKGQWGGSARPIFQQVVPIRPGGPIRVPVAPSDPRLSYFTRIWSRLPFPVVRFLGPKLRQYVPFG